MISAVVVGDPLNLQKIVDAIQWMLDPIESEDMGKRGKKRYMNDLIGKEAKNCYYL